MSVRRPPQPLLGALHGESDRVDSAENIESYLRHMRDEEALQFIATSYFDSEEETSNDEWKEITLQIAEFNEDDRFVGHVRFSMVRRAKDRRAPPVHLYTKDARPIFRHKDTKHNSLKKIYKTHNPKDIITIPSFTMGKTTLYNFEDFNPDIERVVEIYNAWGCSECTAKEGNPCPISGRTKRHFRNAEGSIQKALNAGCRFGFVAGRIRRSRTLRRDSSIPTKINIRPGLTAIFAKEHNRASLLEALNNRSCYATTGEKIILGLHIARFPMGTELDTKTRPGLEFNRHITGYADRHAANHRSGPHPKWRKMEDAAHYQRRG